MSKKTLALVAGLTVLTLVLVVLALNTGKNTATPPGNEVSTETPTPTAPAHTTIELSPNPITLTAGKGTISVMIDAADNEVTGAQFDLVYDPKQVSIGSIVKGDFFTNSIVFPTDTATPGRVTYMIGLTPAGYQNPKTGNGTVATFTVTRRPGATGSTTINLENVLISAKKVEQSVLKSATGTTVILSANTASPSSR